jgi:hypothetical protein
MAWHGTAGTIERWRGIPAAVHTQEYAMPYPVSESAARRAAKRIGLIARKTRWRRDTIDNRGGFQLLNPYSNWIVAGEKFDLSPDDVVAFCHRQAAT